MSDNTKADAEGSAVDRRSLIKRAAAAGAVAWAAPVIIESLASPAAALTGPTGCTVVCFGTGSGCGFNQNSATCFAQVGCTGATNQAAADCVTVTPQADGKCDDGPVTVSICCGCNGCRIDSWNIRR